ncbi:hypothetical protein [Clostridium sp. BNL1100]|uniref:hypothetical protein n=1 Tax=Clostridium sp. BNL1100 TaxID=755731 RepID=UPI00024A752E|nr:hypothetical protein [Clostridium sp. BNL1100]AEY67290.1 hypothetical protein Clo1100_3143 [Clostridium sp. BNL1100]
MRLKTTSKYIFSDIKNSVLIFYLIIALLTIFFSSVTSEGNSSFNGIEMISAIFLFVVGLNSFRKNYLFLMSNGVPRRTQFKSFFLAAIPVTVGMAVIDRALVAIFNRITNYNTLYGMLYQDKTQSNGNIVISLLWSITLYMCAITLGYFITLGYYRMNKIQKICVSIGVPAFFILVLPYIIYNFCSTSTVNWVYNGITTMFGVTGSYGPISAVAVFLVSTILLSVLSYLLIRKAPIKDN